MRNLFVLVVLMVVASVFLPAQDVKLPVFYLRYSGGLGAEQLEEEAEELDPSSLRNSVSLRIKEEFSPLLTTNLTLYYSTKDYYEQSGDYEYFYLKPEISYDLTDRLTLGGEFRSKWVVYDEPGSDGESKDYVALTGGVSTVYKPRTGTRITTTFKSNFDVYENDTKSLQSYAGGLRVESRVQNGTTLGANYRGTGYSALGSASEASRRATHEFGVSVTWDPNK